MSSVSVTFAIKNARLTRKRIAALQAKLSHYGVGFTRGNSRGYAGVFSLIRMPACIVEPVCPMIWCGLELIERAEIEPAHVAGELYKLAMDGSNSVAYA